MLRAWRKILAGHSPMLSIEITKECPLRCPGCYAFNDHHLGGKVTLRGVSELRGDELVEGVMSLVEKYRPVHVSLVGGEPLMRIRELDTILPRLAEKRIHTMIVTSAVIPIPMRWMEIPLVKIAVSVDGLPEHHNIRRHPATYERILGNISERQVSIHLTITHPMLQDCTYLPRYFGFWNSRSEVNRIWISLYTPQQNEQSPEMLTSRDREALFAKMANWRAAYPKLLMTPGIIAAFESPPTKPGNCIFAEMSVNYSADLKTRIEPCVLGGQPDCASCGCAASVGLHSLCTSHLLGPLKVGDMINASIRIGSVIRGCMGSRAPTRWSRDPDRAPRLHNSSDTSCS